MRRTTSFREVSSLPEAQATVSGTPSLTFATSRLQNLIRPASHASQAGEWTSSASLPLYPRSLYVDAFPPLTGLDHITSSANEA